MQQCQIVTFLLRETILIQGFQFFINQRRFLEFWLISPYHSKLGITSSDEIVLKSHESFPIRVCTWLLCSDVIYVNCQSIFFQSKPVNLSGQLYPNLSEQELWGASSKVFPWPRPFSVVKGKTFLVATFHVMVHCCEMRVCGW